MFIACNKPQTMSRSLKSILALIIAFCSGNLWAQDRVDPNKAYKSGETLNAPLFGISMDIPEGWVGYLAREAEIFVLNKANNEGAEVFTFARENTLEQIKKNLKTGLNLSPTVRLKVDAEIEEKDGILSAPVSYTGTTGGQRKAYTFARCSNYGVCATLLLASPISSLDDNRIAIEAMIRSIAFEEPTPVEQLEQSIDWNSFLENKYLYSKTGTGGQKGVVQLWLNADHSFSSKSLPNAWATTPSKKYSGRQKGNWLVTRKGDKDLLILNYNKLDQVTIVLNQDGNSHFLNELVFFVIYQ